MAHRVYRKQSYFRGTSAYGADAHQPNSAQMSVFDGLRSSLLADRAGFFKELAMPSLDTTVPREGFAGSDRLFWLQGMMGSLQGEYDCIKAFSETDFTDDLRKMTIPTLLLQVMTIRSFLSTSPPGVR